ncbi:MAG TPA: MFS transporter [Acidisphaera sp.]|nr:MFS transporter [Acidisphaera sp.]
MMLLRPLRQRAIALLWSGLATSAIGDQLYNVAITWIAVEALGAAAGYLSALQASMTLTTALVVGGWADRRDDRTMMIGADAARALALALLVATAMTTGRTSAAALVGTVVVLAAGQAVFRPALQSLLPVLVPDRNQLPAANALFDATERIARLTGPGLIAALSGILAPIAFLALNAMTFLISGLAVWRIGRLRGTVRAHVPGNVLVQMRRGFTAMRRDPLLGFLLKSTGVLNGVWYAAMFLGLPLALAASGGGGIGDYGLAIASYGVGNLAANLIVGSRPLPHRPGALIFSGNLVNGMGLVLIGAAAGLGGHVRLAAICGASALAGAGGPMNDIPRATLVQMILPHGEVAAGMRAWMATNNAGMLVAMAASPSVVAAFGPRLTVSLCGAVIVALGLLGLVRHAAHAPLPAPEPLTIR